MLDFLRFLAIEKRFAYFKDSFALLLLILLLLFLADDLAAATKKNLELHHTLDQTMHELNNL